MEQEDLEIEKILWDNIHGRMTILFRKNGLMEQKIKVVTLEPVSGNREFIMEEGGVLYKA